MSNPYRLNVRFDLDDEAELRAAEYLAALKSTNGKSRNRFIVEAVISFIEHKSNNRDFTLDDIRQALRAELQEFSFVTPAPVEYKPADTELTKEQQAENAENVLADLSAFF